MSHTYISWEALRYISKEKSVDWYWLLGCVTVLGTFLAYYVDNFSFAAVICISGIALWTHKSTSNDPMHHSIHSEGITVENTEYSYEDIKSFWVFSEGPVEKHRLLLTTSDTFFTHVTIPLGDTDTDQVRGILRKHAVEKKQLPSFADMVLEYLQL